MNGLNDIIDKNFGILAENIVLQAAKDYRKAIKRIKKYPENKADKIIISEVKQFFLSDWFMQLTDLDPKILIKRLNEEVSE